MGLVIKLCAPNLFVFPMDHQNIDIRHANRDDLSAICAIDAEAFSPYGTAESPEVIAARFAVFPEGCLVAVHDEVVIGYVSSEKWPKLREPQLDEKPEVTHDPDGKVWCITAMAVKQGWQNRSVGSSLLARTVELARSARCSSIVLETSHAHHFYEARGFKETGTRWHGQTLLRIMSYRMQIYNVCAVTPDAYLDLSDKWGIEAQAWRWLADTYGIVVEFDALTLKAFYVTGNIVNMCKCISILLDELHMTETTFYPAYSLFASAVELLGRCLRGNNGKRDNTADLKSGFKWLHGPDVEQMESSQDDDGALVVRTNNYAYSIKELVLLRNFCAHGQASYNQATVKQQDQSNKLHGLWLADAPLKDFDYDILSAMPAMLGAGMQAWLAALTSNQTLTLNLMRANVTPYCARPIFDARWNFDADIETYPTAIGNAIRKMHWEYKPGPILTHGL